MLPCMAKTIAVYAPRLFLVEYSDIMIAERGYIDPIPVPRRKRQNDREPITAAPLVPNEKADKNENAIRMQHEISKTLLRP